VRRFLRLYLAFLLAVGAGVASAQTNLPACTSGQLPYQLAVSTIGGLSPAESPKGVCYKMFYAFNVSSLSWDWVEYGDGFCMVQRQNDNAASVNQVVKVCEPSNPYFADPGARPGMTATEVADYMALFWKFVAVAIALLGVKAIYNRFRVDQ